MRKVLDSNWWAFASTLPPATTVLDIGCGAGAVGQELLACQSSLRITGIDFASIPPDPRMELLSNTPMESLPLADRSFEAIVSQFGYEYGRTGEAAREVARVVVSGASLSLLVHHSESPIIAGCKRHRLALEKLTSASIEAAFMSGNHRALEQQFAAIRRDCPGEQIVGQAARGLAYRIHRNEAERAAVWHAVVDALAPELLMLSSLETSFVAPDELMRWLEPLADEFELSPPSTVRMGGGRPLAWKIEGRRR